MIGFAYADSARIAIADSASGPGKSVEIFEFLVFPSGSVSNKKIREVLKMNKSVNKKVGNGASAETCRRIAQIVGGGRRVAGTEITQPFLHGVQE